MSNDTEGLFLDTLRLALPIIIAQIGQMTMGVIDTYVVGQYGYRDLAGVAAGNGIFWPLVIISFGFTLGVETCVSQSHGARRWHERDSFLSAGLVLGGLLSLSGLAIMGLVTWLYPRSGAPAEVLDKALPYLKVVAWSFPPLVLFNILQRYWQARGITMAITLMMIVANALNYYVDLVLVHGTEYWNPMGAVGAAYATVIVRTCLLVGLVLISLKKLNNASEFISFDLVEIKKNISKLLRVGLPAGLQICIELTAFGGTTIVMSYFGAKIVAAHHLVMTVASFLFMFPLGLSSATAIIVGHHYGRNHLARAFRAGWQNIFYVFVLMTGFSIFLIAYPSLLFSFFTNETDIIELSLSVIFLAALFQIFDGIQVVCTGALRGIGNTKVALYGNLFGHAIIGFPAGLVLCFYFDLGLKGVWSGLAIGLILVSLITGYYWWKLAREKIGVG